MDNSPDQRPPLAVAMEWVSKLTTVSLEMILPGLLGNWLDQRWGTSYLVLIGFALGLTLGMWHLLAMVGVARKPSQPRRGKNGTTSEQDHPS